MVTRLLVNRLACIRVLQSVGRIQQRMMRPDTRNNLGTIERVVRVTLGSALAIWALMLLFGGCGLIWLLLYVALNALGVDFVVRGIRGYCPLYNHAEFSH